MTSQIDVTVPVAGNPTTASVRANFATAQGEISALQNNTTGAPFLPLNGGAMLGPMTLYNDPTGPMSPVTLGYFNAHGGGGTGSGGVPEAPADGTAYGRQDTAWHPVLPTSGGTLTGGLHFGSANAASATDLSRHLDLYGGTYGFNVGPSSRLNYNAPTAASHNFLINGASILALAAGAITSAAPIVLPADPASAMQASTKQYTDAQVATRPAEAPNDGNAYLRMSQAWRLGVPQLGAANNVTVAVVERTTGANRSPSLTGVLTPSSPGSDLFSIQARRLATPDAGGLNIDSAGILLYGPTFPTGSYANAVQITTGSTATGYNTWMFYSNGQAYFPGFLVLAGVGSNVYMNAQTAGNASQIIGQKAGLSRWTLVLASGGAESGSNTGSDFQIGRFTDAGGFTDFPLGISRATGVVTFNTGISFPNWYPGGALQMGWAPAIGAGSLRLNVGAADMGCLVRGFTGGGLEVTGMNSNVNGTAISAWIGAGAATCWWSATLNSDRQLKSNIVPCAFDALAMIEQLPIYSADLARVDGSKVHWNCSLIADEVEQVLPEAYQPAPVEGSFSGLHPLPLITTLFQAVKQLVDRVAVLETRAH